MRTNGKHEVIARTARQSLVLAALLGMVLSATSISRAQSSATSTATPVAKSATAPAKAPALPPAKGQHESITVHGHWTIEVKNPDGKVAKHVEFENSLAGNTPGWMLGGQAFLFELLSGNAAFVTSSSSAVSGWAINMQGSTPSSYACAYLPPLPGAANYSPELTSSWIYPSLLPSCIVTNVPSLCATTVGTQGPTATDCNQGLQAVLTTSNNDGIGNPAGENYQFPTPTGFTLSGTVVASQNGGNIGSVSTLVFLNVPQSWIEPGICSTACAVTRLVGFLFTSTNITPVAVSQGQSVVATVSFTFS
jgi:hypothetical protein